MARFTQLHPGADGIPGPTGPKGDKGDQGIQGIQGIQGPKGDTGSNSISNTASASYLSDQTQGPYVTNSIHPMTMNIVEWQNKVTLVDSSRITFTESGKYNIQFSAQLEQLNSQGVVNIWLKKNNSDVALSNTKVNVSANDPYRVAAWNFFIDAAANDYYQIMWSSNSPHTILESATYAPHPQIPSVILTVNQVG